MAMNTAQQITAVNNMIRGLSALRKDFSQDSYCDEVAISVIVDLIRINKELTETFRREVSTTEL